MIYLVNKFSEFPLEANYRKSPEIFQSSIDKLGSFADAFHTNAVALHKPEVGMQLPCHAIIEF